MILKTYKVFGIGHFVFYTPTVKQLVSYLAHPLPLFVRKRMYKSEIQ